MADTPARLIRSWLGRQVPEQALLWLDERTEGLDRAYTARDLYTSIGLAPRKLGKENLRLGPGDLEEAVAMRAGWDPGGLSVDEASRILILLSVRGIDFKALFEDLCRTAEVGELIAFYLGLPLYPGPEKLVGQACEGLRTSMRSVFEAVAHRSPFPAEQFSEAQWNQMVLKALFVESPLHPIQKLDERSNPELARVLCDFAQERWAAGRSVPIELWRCVGPHADEAMLADLTRAFRSDLPLEREAAALALNSCNLSEAKALLDDDVELRDRILKKQLTWGDVITEMHHSN